MKPFRWSRDDFTNWNISAICSFFILSICEYIVMKAPVLLTPSLKNGDAVCSVLYRVL